MAVASSKPQWLRVRIPGGERYTALREMFGKLKLATVCQEARCPNIGECWGEGTATIMILGDTCTRGCRFCAVSSGNPRGVVDVDEPRKIAEALSVMDLAYVVLTMVDRDDIHDGGAAHVSSTVRNIKERCPELLVETLVGDFAGVQKDVATVVQQGNPDVFAHNVEVVPSLQRVMRDARCSWERSVDVLKWARAEGANITKTSLMVGCGETEGQMLEAMDMLREAQVDVLTIGQYLQPSSKHAPVIRYVEPDEFDRYRDAGLQMGFKFVASGPLVRSSYRAAEGFLKGFVKGTDSPIENRYGKKTQASAGGELMGVDERDESSLYPVRISGESPSGVVRVLDHEGKVKTKSDPQLDIEFVKQMYIAMRRTRIIDERLVALQRQGRIGFHIGSVGEEAAVIASVAAMRDVDWVFPCYREFGALLWRGMPLQRYVDNVYGNTNDVVKGRQMPDHYSGRAYRFGSVSSPIGTQMTQAVGFSWASKLKQEGIAVSVYLGEGSSSSAEFHTAMNFAGVFQTPTVFLLRNNGWAISVPAEKQTASKTFADKGVAYGVPAVRVDGNDALAVYKTVKAAAEEAAAGHGPKLIEMITYRLSGHSTSDDPRAYRSEEEVEAWKKHDPIMRLRNYLEQRQAWSTSDEENCVEQVRGELRTCIAKAEQTPAPSIASMFEDVYRHKPWHLEEQQHLAESGPRYKPHH